MRTDFMPLIGFALRALVPMLVLSMLLELSLQHFWIAKMKRMKIKQVTKLYGPSWHEKTKTGTPTLGGVVFFPVMLLSLLCARLFNPSVSFGLIAAVLSYPLLAAAVGLIDDWIKHSRGGSDGLSSLPKLALQIIVTLPWAFWIAPQGLSLLPGLVIPHSAGIALLTFTGVGLQNAVNVTDGLDGLATGSALISFSAAILFISHDSFICMTAAAACGICLGFLWHNSNPASVFMGDVGAHFFAGLLLSLCVMSGSFVFIIPLGFIFGIEIISVAIQIVSIRLYNRKIFRMSPIHHHFEMLGWSEQQIVTRFWIIHIIGLLASILALFLSVYLK